MKKLLFTIILFSANAFPQTFTTAENLCDTGSGFKRDCRTVRANPLNPDYPTIAHKLTGVAPAAIWFDSGAEGEGFHNLHYSWNFGDPLSGNFSTNGLPKNTDTGPIAIHVYETPGTYTATLEVRDATGVIETKTAQITITDPDVAYAGSATTCIAGFVPNNANLSTVFDGCPSGSTVVTVPSAGSFQLNANGSYFFEPIDGFTGEVPATIVYTETGGSFGSIKVNVSTPNSSATGQLAELVDGELLVEFRVNDGADTYQVGTQATIAGVGSLQVEANGSYSFTPVTGFTGNEPLKVAFVDTNDAESETYLIFGVENTNITSNVNIDVATQINEFYVNNDPAMYEAGDTADIVTDAYEEISAAKNNNSRVLLRRGDKFWMSTRNSLNLQNFQMNAFGVCTNPDVRGICENAPNIHNTNGRQIFLLQSATNDVTVTEISITTLGFNRERIGGGIMHMIDTNEVLVHKVKSRSFGGSAFFGSRPTYATLSDSDVAGGGSVSYIFGRQIALFASDIKNNDAQFGHVTRIPGAFRSLFAHSRYSGVMAPSQHLFKLHGLSAHTRATYIEEDREITDTSHVVISKNIYGRGGAFPVAIAPQNNSFPEPIDNVIFEKNRFNFEFGNPVAGGGTTLLKLEGTNITVRNNFFDKSNSLSAISPRIVDASQLGSLSVYGIKVYNNTIYNNVDYDGGNTGEFIGVRICATCKEDSEVINNLVIIPLNPSSTDRAVDDVVNSANPTSQSVVSNNLFIEAPEAEFFDVGNGEVMDNDFSLTGTSPAINTGVSVPVFDDFYGNLRTGNHIGAGDVK